nr:hypothetical protein [Tanacetum cinerariifolium]
MGFHLMDLADFETHEEAPQSSEQAPPSPDYVPGPEHPPSPDYVPGLEYPEYVAPADDEILIEDQPLPIDASATALSPGYIDECDPSKDPEEDPADYPTDGGDDEKEEQEEESSKDDDDDDEASKEDEEEEEHLALADSAILPVTDPVPLDEETEPFETDESAPMPPPPRSPQTKDLFSQTRLCRA